MEISRIFIGVILFGVLAGFSAGCSKQPIRYSEKESREAANIAAAKSLRTLRKLISEENYKQMGFDSLGEVANAALDYSIPEFAIDVASVREYRSDGDPGTLLVFAHSLVYPVLVSGEVRTSITMAYRDQVWKAQSFGHSNFTRLLAIQLAAQSKNQKLDRNAFFIVRVPAFNLVFLGFRINRKFMFAPVFDAPEYDLVAGTPVPADIIVEKLQAAARDYNDLPR